jgi:transposase InsO family protein
MIVTLDTRRLTCVADMQAFLDGSDTIHFHAPDPAGRRQWLADLLRRFGYASLRRTDKGVLRSFAQKVCGYSRAQVARLIAQWRTSGSLADRRGAPARPFSRRYDQADVRALVELDRLHGQLSGPATCKLAERAATVYGDARYARLAGISVAHLYNLRASIGYRRQRGHYEPTRPRASTIGERRRPEPNGQPGYLRVDSVHQGDFDGIKGVYLINLVDAVTQYEVVGAVARISEAHLLPLLEQALTAFPFAIVGFHTDNGSEYINRQVAKLLDKLRIEFTKSRPRRSNDNALAESKNASVVRKHLGYSHIPARHAQRVNAFLRDQLTPYLNFHRPCFFPSIVTDDKGRQRRTYPKELINTPYEKLKSLPKAEAYLKPGITFKQLDRAAMQCTDSQAAQQLNQTRSKLFQSIFKPKAAA